MCVGGANLSCNRNPSTAHTIGAMFGEAALQNSLVPRRIKIGKSVPCVPLFAHVRNLCTKSTWISVGVYQVTLSQLVDGYNDVTHAE